MSVPDSLLNISEGNSDQDIDFNNGKSIYSMFMCMNVYTLYLYIQYRCTCTMYTFTLLIMIKISLLTGLLTVPPGFPHGMSFCDQDPSSTAIGM